MSKYTQRLAFGALLLTMGCVDVSKWEDVGPSLYRMRDTTNGVVCYTTPVRGELSCVRPAAVRYVGTLAPLDNGDIKKSLGQR